VIDVSAVPDSPPAELRRLNRGSAFAAIGELIARRDLVLTLARRDFTARYKQTILGVGWAIVLPVLTISIFNLFVRRVANADTAGAPYALWSYLGLLPWLFFTNSVSNGGLSLLSNQPLLNKVHSPRQVYPIAAVALASVDMGLSALALGAAFGVFRYVPQPTCYWIPLILLVQVLWTVGITVLCSIVTVYIRDVRALIPVLLQLGLFATPVVYALDQVPASYRQLYCFLNPMAPVIDSYRRVVLYGQNPVWSELGAGALTSVILVVVAFRVFARFEQGIVDII
jgi:ABC-2 type transport system permease protein/lipopolysaccharide transport system permease protein